MIGEFSFIGNRARGGVYSERSSYVYEGCSLIKLFEINRLLFNRKGFLLKIKNKHLTNTLKQAKTHIQGWLRGSREIGLGTSVIVTSNVPS